MEPVRGFEPLTCGLRNRCSATELHRLSDRNLFYFLTESSILQTSLCQPAFNYPAGLHVRGRDDVAVGVNCGLDAGMTQPGRDDVHRHPRGREERCMGVPRSWKRTPCILQAFMVALNLRGITSGRILLPSCRAQTCDLSSDPCSPRTSLRSFSNPAVSGPKATTLRERSDFGSSRGAGSPGGFSRYGYHGAQYSEGPFLQVQVAPEQSADLRAPQSGVQRQVNRQVVIRAPDMLYQQLRFIKGSSRDPPATDATTLSISEVFDPVIYTVIDPL